MDYADFILLFISGMAGGALNATVGGGWFIVFPSIISQGRQPVSANAMTTATLWSGHITSMKSEGNTSVITKQNKKFLWIISLTGGISGAFLLVIFSHQTFEDIGPYLLLCSWIMFTFNKPIVSYLESKEKRAFEYSRGKLIPLFLLQVYGSYFGAGVGMMFIALIRYYGLKHDKEVSALKDLMVLVNNGIALFIYMYCGLIHWPFAIALISGSTIGGYYGAALSQRVNMIVVKRVMIIVGALVTLHILGILDLDAII
ncbi:sulfite exporter TauE/SafE family protein [Flavobacterium sp. 3-210]